MTLEKELVRIQSNINGYKTSQSTYSDSAKLYKATYNPGTLIDSIKGFKLTCLTTVPLENAVFQISPQCAASVQSIEMDTNPMLGESNVFYWMQMGTTQQLMQTDTRYFTASSVTITSNVPFELVVELVKST